MDNAMADLPIVRRAEVPDAAFHDAVWGRVFNHRRDARLPRAVVLAGTVADVQAGVSLARAEGCGVSVRSGGASFAAWSVRDGAVLIDLGRLDGGGPEYDPETQVVSVGPATTGSALNKWLAAKGRFFAGGHCPNVGLGGFLLQGGMGWNAKNWGWACESVVGVDVVTAKGEIRHCSETENEDLFWAARGAGPGFPAIVTRWHLKTRPKTGVYQSLYFYPASEFHTVLQWVIDTSKISDEDMEVVAVSLYLPDKPDIHILANFTVFKSTAAAALAALSPIHASRPPGAVTEVYARESSMEEQYGMQKQANPRRHRLCADSAYMANELPPGAPSLPAVLAPAFLSLPTRKSCALYLAMYPTSRRALPPMALSMQTDHFFALYAVWEDEGDDARARRWVEDEMRAAERYAEGSYLGDADFRVRGARFWGPDEGRRLEEVRRTWDPEGTMCGYLVDEKVMRNEHDWVESETS